ncbi:P63C domain-containing protein [Pseudoxanthomonas sp.]|uniref:P63C domain-containing protein n=1 Tax=Pseudoxanthomonas sp. TaxID=1871049 RepID=UPI003F818309
MAAKKGKEVAKADKSNVEVMPHSLLRGTLRIGDLELECHVLSDYRRVLTQREIVKAISGGRESGNLRAYFDRNPLLSNDLEPGAEIHFRVDRATTSIGREATTLIEICERYLEAYDRKLLKPSQYKLAKQAQIIIRACAKVGIIALVDEATGFQKMREKRALQLKLQAFIAEEMQEWARVFPDEFWLELARLEGIKYSPKSRPLRWGKYIMAFVYDAIDKDVGKKLREINPDPQHGRNHHQWLKGYGKERVTEQITKVVTIMNLCDNMDDFRAKFRRVFKKSEAQLDLFYDM